MSKGIFVTGTGTDVGKTFVTALITRKLWKHGLNAGYYKPVLSGAQRKNGKLIPGDADYVCKISGLEKDPNSLVSYIYETAVSPHLASKIEQKPIEMQKIISDFEKIKEGFDYITVEGSGGIVCPLRIDDQTIMLSDVIKALSLDVILVAPAALGTINSTVLTVEYAKQNEISIKGIIFNCYERDNFLHKDNKRQIAYITGIPIIACVDSNANDMEIDAEILEKLYREI
ncbi:dethiobiotin synthase [Desulfofarcimen acetoxidans DSM 771]|uniref:ATP-dependent dethiobiotin synthetase BioD n=1 Tax=Desulfofarcimen acetoxidans (strain ATCC 49208 / DSM 771 / KCTC 5769 / VKM B-1644 / 5575) TaxID=485916 RepID=C8W026_DESAS|nr:dethiobiotin synthase [Desulfofarcimen acetoxidans]ACV64994.1 dethiobiotin synthase [Desulfofarcimen acetoxidans DSM 771]